MSSESTPSSISSTAFADALARARQLAAKLSSSGPAAATSPPQASTISQGVKRSADDWKSSSPDSEPEAKRKAALSDPFGAQLAAMNAMKTAGAPPSTSTFTFPMMGISGSGKACTEEVHIPDGLVGLIIGRGGEQVSRIQAETGCKVQVAPDNGTGKDRSCYLQGSKDAIERAKELIMEIVSSKSHELGRPGGPTTSASAVPKVAPGSTSVEMTIPGPKVGLIIGKGGETIRSLQDKSGTKMYILQDNMFEECDKPLRIVGEPDLVEHARQLVMDLITETPPKPDYFKSKNSEYGSGQGGPPLGSSGGGGGGSGSGGSSSFGTGAGLETMRFPVPKISVGLIIGKGGEMIKRIQMETGAKVQFDPINSNLGDMDEQLAIITGKPEQIRQAQLRIEDLVETALQGGKPDGQQTGGPGGPRGGPGREHRQHNNWNNSSGEANGPGSHHGGGGHDNKNRNYEEERMPVPVGRVGMVIGKGGETIRAINNQSGAHCEIDRNGPNDGPERIFLLRGTRQQIEYAKELILEKVNTLPPKPHQRDGRGGPGGHHGHHQGGGPDHYGQSGGQGWGSGGGYGAQGGGGQWGQGDPSKMGDTSAQWAAYYAHYYGTAQPTTQAQPAGGAGQPDYTQQWIEYLRAQGQHAQADQLEQQMKATKGPQDSNPPPPGSQGPAPPGTNPPGVSSNGQQATQAATTAQNGQTPDYSQQWADHYRSLGKVAEAEAIENYIKAQKAQQQAAPPGVQPTPGGGQPSQQPPGQGYQGYPGYGNYYGQQAAPQQPPQNYGGAYGSAYGYPGMQQTAGGPGQSQPPSNAAPPPGTESSDK